MFCRRKNIVGTRGEIAVQYYIRAVGELGFNQLHVSLKRIEEERYTPLADEAIWRYWPAKALILI